MRKVNNYRNPTSEELARQELFADVVTLLSGGLALAMLVGWCLVLN